MDDTRIDIYLAQQDIENILFNDEKYPNLFQIVKGHARLFVNLEPDELDAFLYEMNELVDNLIYDIPIYPQKETFDAIKADCNIIISKSKAIFFLDIPSDEANSLSRKYGIIVQSSRNIKDDILQLSYYKYFEKNQKYGGVSDGWTNSLKGLELPPYNSLVITDDYLLANTIQDKNVGFENLKMMLNAILPKELGTTFHLLIITPMEKISTKKADRLNGELKAYLRTIRPYDFNLEFVFRDTIHPRKAFANYFVIVCDKGFKLFNPIDKSSGYEEENDVRFSSLLHDASQIRGDSYLMASKKELVKIRKLCNELSERINMGVPDHSKRIIGDTNKDKTVRNRLLN